MASAVEIEALEFTPSGVGIFDLSGQTIRMVYLNDGFYRMIGARRSDRSRFFDTGTINSVHPDDRAGILAEAQAAVREKRMFKLRFRNLDGEGSYIWIGITANHKPLDATTERFYASYQDLGDIISAQKHDREEYEKSLGDILSAVPDALGIAHIDLTTGAYSWSRKPMGWFDRLIKGDAWDDVLHAVLSGVPDEEERANLTRYGRDGLLQAFKRGESHLTCNYRRAGENGVARWISSHFHLLRNPESDHVECVAYTLDISKAVRRREIFQIITSCSFDLVAVIHLASQRFEAIYLGESIPSLYRDLLPESGAMCDFAALCEESSRHMDADTRKDYESRLSPDYILAGLDRGGGSYEFTLKEHFEDAGQETVYRRYLHYRLDSDPDSILVIESDVTAEVLRHQEDLAKAKTEAERDRWIMDSITSGIAELHLSNDGKLSVESFNKRFFRMLGYEASDIPQRVEEAVGTPYAAAFANALCFVHPDDKERTLATFENHRDDEEFSLDAFRMMTKDGTYRWIATDAKTKGRGSDGVSYLATYRDVTWELEAGEELRRRLEEERALRAKADVANAAKSDFLSRMSHDIRTPLNGIIGMAYLAGEQDNPPRTADCLNKIDTSAKFLLGLINDVLDMAKVESGKVELRSEPYPLDDFHAYLDAVIRPLCDEKGVRFVTEEDMHISSWPLCDRNAVSQVLFNLLSNAVKFTPEGGTVTYCVRARQRDGRIHTCHRISDTGVGMSTEFLERVFEPFSQEGRNDVSENRGSGLGLAIARRLVSLMGGTIEVESELGKGTVFTLALDFPAAEPSEEAKLAGAVSNATNGCLGLEGARVLLCEDHPLNQEIAIALLTEKGVSVDVADNGEKGIETFCHSTPGFYDAILMDIRMPVMDGYEAARAIRALDRPDAERVPIIAMTADAFEGDVRRCLEAGMNAHVAKPVNPQDLFRVLAERIGMAQDV